MNRLLMATIGGVVAGAIGAALWAGVAYGLNRELGILAWGLGGLVGAGVAVGAKGEVGLHTGILAAILSIAAICAGKFVVANALVDDELKGSVSERMAHFGEPEAKAYLAAQLTEQQESAGTKLEWPADMDSDTASELKDYPAVIVTDVEARWNAMDQTARTDYTTSARENTKANIGEAVQNVKAAVFVGTFGPMDVLFFILAIITSFRLGASGLDS